MENKELNKENLFTNPFQNKNIIGTTATKQRVFVGTRQLCHKEYMTMQNSIYKSKNFSSKK